MENSDQMLMCQCIKNVFQSQSQEKVNLIIIIKKIMCDPNRKKEEKKLEL